MRKLILTNEPYQSFLHSVANIELRLVLSWNNTNKYWAMDVYDNLTGDLLQGGSAITSGTDLLSLVPPYTLEGIFLTAYGLFKDPGRHDLSSGALYIGVTDAV